MGQSRNLSERIVEESRHKSNWIFSILSNPYLVAQLKILDCKLVLEALQIDIQRFSYCLEEF